MMENRTLLVVLAHPDDETFRCGGTLALLAQMESRCKIQPDQPYQHSRMSGY